MTLHSVIKNKGMDKKKLRKGIYYLFTFQIMLISWVSLNSPFIANNFTSGIVIQAIACAALGFYSLDLKNVKGWWLRKIMEAKNKIAMKQEIENEIKRRNGLK